MKIKSIPLDTIHLKDERFRTSYFCSLDRLIHSIKKVGLLSPPRLRAGEKGWVIVAGWKRILASFEVRLHSIPAVEATERKDLDCFLSALEENLASRELSFLEKSIALRKLEEFGVEKERLVREFLPVLSLPATATHLDFFLCLARADSQTKRFVAEKNPPLAVLERLLKLRPTERTLVLPLLRPLGQNKQKELLEDLLEISLRDDKPVRQVLAEAGAKTGAAKGNLAALEKAEKFRAELRRRRYPRLSRARADFAAVRKRMALSESILIEPDPFFEDPGLTVTFRCQTSEEFKHRLAELQKVASRDALAALFRAARES